VAEGGCGICLWGRRLAGEAGPGRPQGSSARAAVGQEVGENLRQQPRLANAVGGTAGPSGERPAANSDLRAPPSWGLIRSGEEKSNARAACDCGPRIDPQV
jgi:hypothetical protein